MLRRVAIAVVCVSAVTGVCLTLHRTYLTASAAGSGPTIVLGAAAGANVPVNAGISPDAYRGFNLHVAATPSAGVALTAITGSAAGSALDTAGGLFCNTQVPAVHEVNYGCVALDGQSTSVTDLLATMTLTASGNGCISVRLVDLPPSDPNAVVSDTYTVDQLTSTLQQNAVSVAATLVTVGTGTVADCASGGGPVGGVAVAPDLPDTASASRGALLAAAIVALVVLLAFGAAGWRIRVRRLL